MNKFVKNRLHNFLVYNIFSLTFLGYYVVLLLTLNAGLDGVSRQITIPLRLLLGLGIILLFIINFKQGRPFLKWFFLFSLLYFLRIFLDYIQLKSIHISYVNLIFYFISFCFIPFIGLSKINFWKINFNKLFNYFLVAAFSFSFLSNLFYGRYVGKVSRLYTSIVNESVVSPLILSYCSSLIIGVNITYLLFNKISNLKKIFCVTIISMSLIPFFLGASTGSLLAILFPFTIIYFSRISIVNTIKFLGLILIFIIIIYNIGIYFKSGLFNRLMEKSEMLDSSTRTYMWGSALRQFGNNPIFGDKITNDYQNFYPHNVGLEVLQSLGILGFLPFIYLIIKAFKACKKIFKFHKSLAWFPILFLQAFIQSMFSGALYSSAWLWSSLALLLSLDLYLNKKRKFL